MSTETLASSPVSARRRSDDAAISIQLATDIKRGCTQAESQLVQRYQPGLTYLANHYTSDPELAGDVVQETLIVVLQRLRDQGIAEPEKLTPFVQKTARNIMIGQLRKIDRRQTFANTPEIERTCAENDSQEKTTTRQQDAEIVRELLQELPSSRDQELLTRFYLDDEDKASICQALMLSDVHFNRVLYRARKRFASLVEKYERESQSDLLYY